MAKNKTVQLETVQLETETVQLENGGEAVIVDSSENLDFSSESVETTSEFGEKDFVSILESEKMQKDGKSVVEIKEFNGIMKHRLV